MWLVRSNILEIVIFSFFLSDQNYIMGFAVAAGRARRVEKKIGDNQKYNNLIRK